MGFFTHSSNTGSLLLDHVAIPFRVGWGFSRKSAGANQVPELRVVAIPFRVGWGFSRAPKRGRAKENEMLSQSLSGWDGVFHLPGTYRVEEGVDRSRNPFQGGMGFFTLKLEGAPASPAGVAIPFRVGWGFSQIFLGVSGLVGEGEAVAIPFRVGWGFSRPGTYRVEEGVDRVAIPFRVGWGFSPQILQRPLSESCEGRNPFQGGMGFFTAKRREQCARLCWSRNPFQGGMGFFTPVPPDRLGCKPAAAFRQPQVCPPKTSKKL